MGQSMVFREYLEKAGKDLGAAKTYRGHGTAYEVPAFMCHQAVEKALIGYLHAAGEGPITTHDLPYLGRWAAKYLPELGALDTELALVNRYYLEMTYPDDLTYTVSAAIVDQCIAITERVLAILQGAGGN